MAWPFRTAWAVMRRNKGLQRAKVKRIIFLGLDGLDPGLTERFMGEGGMPNLSRLKEQGSFQRLRTTHPPQSPVAWSTFATGVSPAKHNIFDFLNRSLRSYTPELSSARIRAPRRVLRIGRLRIPLARPTLELHRKSESFWKILGKHGIGSTIIRVPITFPPEKFQGRLLSAMCTPDLRGTQGSFSQFTTRIDRPTFESGGRYPLARDGDELTGVIEGPENEFLDGAGALAVPFRILPVSPDGAALKIAGESHRLARGEYSPWIKLTFRAGPAAIQGIVRFLLTETEPEFSLYVTPVQIDPESPALPISHPSYYSQYLAKLLGPFATAGMAEDTWALNEGVIDEAAFLEQAYLTMRERETMFENALGHTRRGVVACVFDTSDRVQHMFFRHLDSGKSRWQGAIRDLYQRMDALAGKAMAHVDDDTLLFVLSDHGFCGFRRAVNLNSWLHQNGYLVLNDGAAESGRYFEGVDWGRTRAYCLGLSGLYLNLRGRESAGVVDPRSEAEALKRDLIHKLSGLPDEERGEIAIRQVYATSSLYRGPYLDAAPDLIVGYNKGYRTSWEAAVGQVTARVMEDNSKAWSGDHCVDPLLVPGVLFCNRRIHATDPGIEDLAPTALELFGVEPPVWMDGKPLPLEDTNRRAA
ncbi:MAG: alkaline phosphatase family protein [Acidobacteriaceae bacterium]|nr:alkaline phosphatase family protein [Acidobacteriaceae bacterium]